jgi:hypothetical protein
MDNTSEVGPGWAPLIRILDAHAAALGLEVLQVKQKFAGLRYYYQAPRSVDAKELAMFERLLGACETLSFCMCEVCGAPATQVQPRFWMFTLCPTHAREAQERAR